MKNKILLYNGKIFTKNGINKYNTAIQIKGNKIERIGSDDELKQIINSNIKTIDLEGKVVFPGFIDTHFHLSEWAKRKKMVNLDNFNSLEDVLIHLQKNIPAGEWYFGGGWNHNDWKEDRLPNMNDLLFIKNKKVILFSKDFHSVWINDPVLDLIDTKELVHFIQKKMIETNNLKQITGIIKEEAIDKLINPLIKEIESPIFDDPKEYFEELNKVGLTSIHTIETFKDYQKYKELYQNIYKRGPRLGFLIYERDREDIFRKKIKTDNGGNWFKYLGLKIILDGALGSQSAWMREPYENKFDDVGINFYDDETLEKIVEEAELNENSIAIHAIGDKALEQLLNVFEKYNLSRKSQYRIEHAQIIPPDLFEKIKLLRPKLSMNPSHIFADIKIANKHWGDRSRYAYRFRSLLNENIPFSFGSDAPVEKINPWKGIRAAVKRQNNNGESWYPEEKITLTEAINAYTINGAKISNEDDVKGKLSSGYLADLFVASENPYEIDIDDIENIESLLTIIDGNIVYNKL